MILTANRCEYQ